MFTKRLAIWAWKIKENHQLQLAFEYRKWIGHGRRKYHIMKAHFFEFMMCLFVGKVD